MVKKLEAPEDLLSTAANESCDIGGTEEAVPIYRADDCEITDGELNGRDVVSTIEPREAGRNHAATISGGGGRERGEGLPHVAILRVVRFRLTSDCPCRSSCLTCFFS